MRITIDGIDKLRARLDPAKAPRQLAGALFVEANRIMTISKRDHVPVDQGTLRASGFVARPAVTKRKAAVTMGYGGAAAQYALVQHERTDFRHTVGGPKYLERPVRAARRGIGRRMAKHLDLF